MNTENYRSALGLAGNQTIDRTGRSKSAWQPTPEEMYLTKNLRSWATAYGHHSLHRKYQQAGYGQAHGLRPDGRVRPVEIVDIQPFGFVPCVKIVTATGSAVCVGRDQMLMRPGSRDVAADDLCEGDELLLRAARPTSKASNYRLTSGERRGGGYDQSGFPQGESNPGWVDGGHAKFNARRDWLIENVGCCQQCGTIPARFEVHHVDGCRTNNHDANLRLVCVSCHKRVEYRLGRTRRGGKGYDVVAERIVRIDDAGEQLTYTITLAGAAAFSVGRLLVAHVMLPPLIFPRHGREAVTKGMEYGVTVD